MIRLINQSTVMVIIKLFFDDPSIVSECVVNPDEAKTIHSASRFIQADIGTAYFTLGGFYIGPKKSYDQLTGEDCFKVTGNWIIHIEPVPCKKDNPSD